MKTRIIVIVGALSLGLAAVGVAAQEKQEISEVLNSAVPDTVVTVEGDSQPGLEPNSFVINDGTGEIPIDLGPPWWETYDINPGEAISVTGEVGTGRDGDKPKEIGVITLTRENGDVVNVRPAEGPPPWAGGPAKVGSKHPGHAGYTNSQR